MNTTVKMDCSRSLAGSGDAERERLKRRLRAALDDFMRDRTVVINPGKVNAVIVRLAAAVMASIDEARQLKLDMPAPKK